MGLFGNFPASLLHQATDNLFSLISVQLSIHGNLKTTVEVFRDFLGQLPKELQTSLLKRAEKSLDQAYSVRCLMVIWMSCLDNVNNLKEVSTPRYLYNDSEARKMALEKLAELGRSSKRSGQVQCLSFFMYSFYTHSRNKQPLFELNEDDQLTDPRVTLNPEEQVMLANALKSFPNLSALILPTVVNTEILEMISCHLKTLKILDVSCSTNVTDYGIMALVGDRNSCDHLEQVFLEGTSVTSDGILMILARLRKLEVIESSLLERALDSLPTEEVLKLKKVTVGRFWRNNDILMNLSGLCPDLNQLILPNISRDQIVHLQALSGLHDLAHLHLGQVKFQYLIPALVTLGPRLASFTYSNFSEFVDIGAIAQHCSQLQCLGINAGCLVLNETHHQRASLTMPERLKDVRLNVHAMIAKNVWTKLLIECLQIEHIDITPADGLDDETLDELLAMNLKSLKNLSSFVVRGRHRGGDILLSRKSIEALACRCPNLRAVGDCSTWSMPSSTEFLSFG